MIDGKIAQANGRLRSAKVGVAIGMDGDRLHLRATFPPKPGSSKAKPFQQRLYLGYHANPAGIKRAEQEARKVGALLDCEQFDWREYITDYTQVLTAGDWIAKFETDYFTRRAKNPKSETTWKYDYLKVFSKLDARAHLTSELLREAIERTRPDSRTRKRFVDVCTRLGNFGGLSIDFKFLQGHYSPKHVTPRNLPIDDMIATWRDRIPNPTWQRAYGLIAVYGLRPHELFWISLDRFPIVEVLDGAKTTAHIVYPYYPEWAESWDLVGDLPKVSGKTNTDLGNRVTHAFGRYHIPFAPYDLRHAWAVRTIRFGLPDTLAARQMGHSVQVHTQIYHAWITADEQQRMYDTLMSRSDRPKPPSLDE